MSSTRRAASAAARDIRAVLIPRVHERYGKDRSALVAAFPTFKARGAMNRFRATPPEAAARGLVTASGGNHLAQVGGDGQTPAQPLDDRCVRIGRPQCHDLRTQS